MEPDMEVTHSTHRSALLLAGMRWLPPY